MKASGANAAHGVPQMEKPSLAARIVEELRQFVVMFLYLWILLGLFTLYQVMTLAEHGIAIAPFGFAALNALVLAKVMVIVEHFDITGWLRSRPLAFAVVFESLLLSVLFILFHVIEHTIIGMLGGESLRAAVPIIGSGGLFGLLSVSCILFFSLVPFFAFKNLSRVLGSGLVMALFLGTKPT